MLRRTFGAREFLRNKGHYGECLGTRGTPGNAWKHEVPLGTLGNTGNTWEHGALLGTLRNMRYHGERFGIRDITGNAWEHWKLRGTHGNTDHFRRYALGNAEYEERWKVRGITKPIREHGVPRGAAWGH